MATCVNMHTYNLAMANRYLLLITLIIRTSISFGQAPSVEDCTKYLLDHHISPEQYIIQTFNQVDIILLGEDHRVKENLDFVSSLIPLLYANGIYTIGMEFGAYEDQKRLDSLITAETYDEAVARKLMFNYNPGWAFQEYMDIYKSAWAFNKTRTNSERKFKILNLSYTFNWASFSGQRTPETMKTVFYQGNPERYRFKILEENIITQNEKILILTGDIHAFTQYKFPNYDYLSENFVRFDDTYFGNLIYAKYPNKVFSILLHKPFYNYPNKKPTMVSPANGKIEEIMKRLNNKPVGFDLINTPLGHLPDSSYYSMGYVNFELSDLFDGYIFLKPIKSLSACTIDTLFLNEQNWPQAYQNMPDPDWRPKPTTLAEYWKQIHAFADIPKIYEKTDEK